MASNNGGKETDTNDHEENSAEKINTSEDEKDKNRDKRNGSEYVNDNKAGNRNESADGHKDEHVRINKTDVKKEKDKLHWLDKLNDDISEDFYDVFTSKYKDYFNLYDIEKLDTLEKLPQDKKDKFIIVCRASSQRIAHMLNFYLNDLDDGLFESDGRVLVIIVHNEDLGEVPHVSSKVKIGDLERYKGLGKNVIDVSYKEKKGRLEILHPRICTKFNESQLKNFLKIKGVKDQSSCKFM